MLRLESIWKKKCLSTRTRIVRRASMKLPPLIQMITQDTTKRSQKVSDPLMLKMSI
jgi:hypothetical protein